MAVRKTAEFAPGSQIFADALLEFGGWLSTPSNGRTNFKKIDVSFSYCKLLLEADAFAHGASGLA